MAKPIELTLSYFGKSITQKQYSSVLHVSDLYKMFKGIMIGEFGQDVWDDITKGQIDKEIVDIDWEAMEEAYGMKLDY
jgi:hypothetical protein